jgi:hypothetical protein
MGVSILSFGGRVQFGLITDAAVVPDPEAITARFNPEFEQLLYSALMAPWEGEPPPPREEPEEPAPEPRRGAPPKKPAPSARRPVKAARRTPAAKPRPSVH